MKKNLIIIKDELNDISEYYENNKPENKIKIILIIIKSITNMSYMFENVNHYHH